MVKFNRGTSVRLATGQTATVVKVMDAVQANSIVVTGGTMSNGDDAGGGLGIVSGLMTGPETAAMLGGAKVFLSVKLNTTGSVVQVSSDRVVKLA